MMDVTDTRTHFEKRLDKYEADLASLEEHVQHIAATLVAIVEGAKANKAAE